MNYLLDTHTIFWFLNGDDKLSKHQKNLLKIKIILNLSVLLRFGR